MEKIYLTKLLKEKKNYLTALPRDLQVELAQYWNANCYQRWLNTKGIWDGNWIWNDREGNYRMLVKFLAHTPKKSRNPWKDN